MVSEELAAIVERFGDERRTTILPFDGTMNVEDLIPVEDIVVTITRGGYAKRTRTDAYRAQRRGGKGVRGAQLRGDDVVDQFFVTTTHSWMLFFTNLGRVYRAKGYELPEGGRDAKGQHVANLLAFQPGEEIAQVLTISGYDEAEYLVLATKRGLVKKTRLTEYDSSRSGGVIAINLRTDAEGEVDEVVSARIVNADDDVLLVSRGGQSIRFTASDDALRPMSRATSGVTGMKFRNGDELLALDVVRPEAALFTVTQGGYAKRTLLDEYRVQGRGGLGIKVANVVEARGDLVGALVTDDEDEVLVIMEKGKVVRSPVAEVNLTGRNTQGVIFAKPDAGDRIIAVALGERADQVDEGVDGEGEPEGGPDDGRGDDSVEALAETDAVAPSGGADGVGSGGDDTVRSESESDASGADEYEDETP